MGDTTRRFVDAGRGERCAATIVLRDNTLAQCGRRRSVGALCTQHETIRRDAGESNRAAELQRIQDEFSLAPAPRETVQGET